MHRERYGEDFQGAMVVAGESPDRPGGGAPQESEHVMNAIKASDVPVLYVPHTTYRAMEMVSRAKDGLCAPPPLSYVWV